uniref:translocation/assembly module TamB n=1 Tax=Gillisia marina TaxID=1167637 RepID=UPI0004941C4D|nr:translocation/assembly module TamB domain-containing protein [Gillisia marina]
MKTETTKTKRFFKILGKIALGLLLFILLLLLFIRSPWGQGIIVNKVISYISEKTNTLVSLDQVFITFSGDIQIEGLYFEDKKGDTLIYSKSLDADIPLMPLIKGSGIVVNSLDWEGLNANIYRKDSLEGFNYEFLVDAFASTDSTVVDTSTASAPLNLKLGDFNFNDFKISFIDKVGGIEADVQLGNFQLEMKETDLENMKFQISNARLSNSSIVYLQTKPFPESEENTSSPLPFISLENLEIESVSAYYNATPDGLATKLDIGTLKTSIPKMDLVNNDVFIDELFLKESDIVLEPTTLTDPKVAEKPKNTEQFIEDFVWPNWTVQVNKVSFIEDQFTYLVDGAIIKSDVYNPNALAIEDFNFEASNIYLKNETAGANIKTLTFKESSGLNLKELTGDLKVSDTNLNVDGLQLKLNDNRLNANAEIKYSSITQLINNPEKIDIAADISNFNADINDLFVYMPELKENEYIRALAAKNLSGNLKLEGSGSSLTVSNAAIKWGNTTSLNANGSINNPMDVDNLSYNFRNVNFKSSRADLKRFVSEEDLRVEFPTAVSLKGSFTGDLTSLKTNSYLTTSNGNMKMVGDFNFDDEIAFDAQFETMELQLGKFLKMDNVGTLNLKVNASGNGKDLNNLNANLEATITSLSLNNYSIKDLKLNGEFLDGEGPITANYKDENLDIALDGYVNLDTIASQIDMNLDVKGADLNALGFTSRNITGALKLNMSFKGDSESYRVNANVRDGLAIYDNDSYLLGNVGITAYVLPDSTSLDINNKMLDLTLRSNANPADLSTALTNHFTSYLHPDKIRDTLINPVSVTLRGKFIDTPILSDVFVTNLEELDTINIKMDFNEKNRKLTASVNVPFVDFYGMQIDSLAFNIDSDATHLNFDFGLNSLNAGPLAIKKTLWDGKITDRKLFMDFSSFYDEQEIVHVKTEITEANDILYLHINPENLILNGLPWNVPVSNEISLLDTRIDFKDFKFTHENQVMSFYSDKPGVTKEHVGVDFTNFTLQTVLSYLDPEEYLAKGILNGELVVEDPFSETGILANLEILNLEVLDAPLGRLVLNAKSKGNKSYDFNLAVKDGNVDLDLTGDYIADEVAAKLNLDLDLNKFELIALEGFSGGEITDGEGVLSGNMKLSGTTLEPIYNGTFKFNNAGFKVAMLNAGFNFPNETLVVDNKGLYFDNFEIQDENNNSFVMDGTIFTETYLNPRFDLSFEATNFTVLNSTKEDNDLFYGTASFDATATLTGDLLLPKLDLDLKVGPDTDVTYIVPESELNIVERDGIVIFVNREDPDDILTKTKEESVVISGYEVNATISIDDASVFNMVIDQETGDNIQGSGEGDLFFSILPNGRTTLSGRIEVSKGHYEMSLYNLVKRRFEIVDGSSITWSGDPFDANLDASAIYRVETSASGLMAPQLGGADQSVAGKFRQELDFLVYLNVDGELMQPVLTFNLDMPEDEQGAIGGQVYGRVQQLNQQGDELNKQVFSLLVLNKFFPNPGSDGSGGGAEVIARDNLNQALSDQLNMLSGKILGDSGLELDFGLNSFTDYQGENPQDRTQLNVAAQKKLLDDRLIVRVGSNLDIQGSDQSPGESNAIIGNVSLEYLLTEDGKFRLKGFRNNTFDNVIDGQLIVSGIALIFTQEFNKFEELFEKAVKEQVDKNEDKK